MTPELPITNDVFTSPLSGQGRSQGGGGPNPPDPNSYLLREDGGFMLREDGFKFIREG